MLLHLQSVECILAIGGNCVSICAFCCPGWFIVPVVDELLPALQDYVSDVHVDEPGNPVLLSPPGFHHSCVQASQLEVN